MARGKLRAFPLFLATLATVLVLTHSLWLAALGGFLVKVDSPAPADLVVVLAGDFYGHRVETGAELVKQGLAPRVLVSGPRSVYGLYECDVAIPFAVKKSFPQEWFIPFRNGARSTYEEAQAILVELRRRAVRRFLLVTSDFHTRRAGRIFRWLGRDFEMRVVAAPDEHFRPRDWWRTREARKVFLMEWLKTISEPLGI